VQSMSWFPSSSQDSDASRVHSPLPGTICLLPLPPQPVGGGDVAVDEVSGVIIIAVTAWPVCTVGQKKKS